MATTVYVLRHASAMVGVMPNRTRPLSDEGRRQATLLVPLLSRLGCAAVFSGRFGDPTTERMSEAHSPKPSLHPFVGEVDANQVL